MSCNFVSVIFVSFIFIASLLGPSFSRPVSSAPLYSLIRMQLSWAEKALIVFISAYPRGVLSVLLAACQVSFIKIVQHLYRIQ